MHVRDEVITFYLFIFVLGNVAVKIGRIIRLVCDGRWHGHTFVSKTTREKSEDQI